MAGILGAHEQYIRHELPRTLQTALKEAVIAETQPTEEFISGQLMNIIGDVQDRVFASYRAATNLIDEPVTNITMNQANKLYRQYQSRHHQKISSRPTATGRKPPYSPSFDIVDSTIDFHIQNSDSAHMSEKVY